LPERGEKRRGGGKIINKTTNKTTIIT